MGAECWAINVTLKMILFELQAFEEIGRGSSGPRVLPLAQHPTFLQGHELCPLKKNMGQKDIAPLVQRSARDTVSFSLRS